MRGGVGVAVIEAVRWVGRERQERKAACAEMLRPAFKHPGHNTARPRYPTRDSDVEGALCAAGSGSRLGPESRSRTRRGGCSLSNATFRAPSATTLGRVTRMGVRGTSKPTLSPFLCSLVHSAHMRMGLVPLGSSATDPRKLSRGTTARKSQAVCAVQTQALLLVYPSQTRYGPLRSSWHRLHTPHEHPATPSKGERNETSPVAELTTSSPVKLPIIGQPRQGRSETLEQLAHLPPEAAASGRTSLYQPFPFCQPFNWAAFLKALPCLPPPPPTTTTTAASFRFERVSSCASRVASAPRVPRVGRPRED